MAKKAETNKNPKPTAEERDRRRQQIIFGILAVILIISWLASMILVL
jgi:hypothetical protein